MIRKKFIPAAIAISLFSCISASATTTYLAATLSGTYAETSYTPLGNGTRHFYGKGISKTGIGKVMKIKKWAPDEPVASFSVTPGNLSTAEFPSQAHIDGVNKGDIQSYYKL